MNPVRSCPAISDTGKRNPPRPAARHPSQRGSRLGLPKEVLAAFGAGLLAALGSTALALLKVALWAVIGVGVALFTVALIMLLAVGGTMTARWTFRRAGRSAEIEGEVGRSLTVREADAGRGADCLKPTHARQVLACSRLVSWARYLALVGQRVGSSMSLTACGGDACGPAACWQTSRPARASGPLGLQIPLAGRL